MTANKVLHFMRKMQPGAQKLFSVSSEGSQLLYINYCWNLNSVIDWNILRGGRKLPTLQSWRNPLGSGQIPTSAEYCRVHFAIFNNLQIPAKLKYILNGMTEAAWLHFLNYCCA